VVVVVCPSAFRCKCHSCVRFVFPSSSVDSEDSNREDHPGCDYGDDSSMEEDGQASQDSDADDLSGSDGRATPGDDLDAIRARVVRELAPFLGDKHARGAVGWNSSSYSAGVGPRYEEYDHDIGGSSDDDDDM
jgi:hypothetical protein